jgi:ankyrin repeat protein
MGWMFLVIGLALGVAGCSASMMDLARRGDLKALKVRIAAGEDVNAGSEQGTALVQASKAGHIEVVRALVTAGADLEVMSWSRSARPGLTRPQRRYKSPVVVNVDSSGPQSSFMASRNSSKVVWVRENGKTALMLAAENGQMEVAELFLETGGIE